MTCGGGEVVIRLEGGLQRRRKEKGRLPWANSIKGGSQDDTRSKKKRVAIATIKVGGELSE